MRYFHARPIAVVAAVLVAAAAESGAHPNHPPVPVQEITTDLTWSKDIRPIFRENCMTCHSPNGTLPLYFDLTTYGGTETSSGAADWAYGAVGEILTGRMPPWNADPRYNSFKNHRYLTDAEIDAVVEWAFGGRPEGLKKDLPAPDEFLSPGWSMGEPDLVLQMPEPHALNEESADDEITVSFPVETDDDPQWIEAIEFRPGSPWPYIRSSPS